MNTNLSSGGNAIKPPIQLKYTYERLLATEQAKTAASNSKIYTEAQAYCQLKLFITIKIYIVPFILP